MAGGLHCGLILCIARVKLLPKLRVVFLTGNGAMFCAGGDPKAFQHAAAQAVAGEDGNDASALEFAQLLHDMHTLPLYLVCLCNGTAMGGGVGLLSVCDYVIARKTASFALSEVKLGVIPATISPYVVARCDCRMRGPLCLKLACFTTRGAQLLHMPRLPSARHPGLARRMRGKLL